VNMLEKILTEKQDMLDFGKEVIPYCIDNCKVYGFLHNSYWEDIGTIKSYHNANIELTKERPAFNFYEPSFPFFSKPRFLPPSKIVSTQLRNVIISDGTILEDSIIEDSIIGIRCVIRKCSEISNSVIIGADFYETDEDRYHNRVKNIPDVGIGRECIVKKAIIDKNCRIGRRVQIINKNNELNFQSENYSIIDGIVVIPKNTIIPDGIII